MIPSNYVLYGKKSPSFTQAAQEHNTKEKLGKYQRGFDATHAPQRHPTLARGAGISMHVARADPACRFPVPSGGLAARVVKGEMLLLYRSGAPGGTTSNFSTQATDVRSSVCSLSPGRKKRSPSRPTTMSTPFYAQPLYHQSACEQKSTTVKHTSPIAGSNYPRHH